MRASYFFAGTALSAIVTFCPLTAALAAQNDPPAWVQTEFKELMSSCLPGINKLKFRSSPKESELVPASIVSGLTLPTAVSYTDFANANMARIFGYVYSDAEKANVSSFVPEMVRYLEIDYDRDDDQITEAGLGTLVFDRDCKGALDLAAEGRANADFAPATLEAAARSALQRKFSARLSLYRGQFENPIVKQWDGNAVEPNSSELMRVYAALTLWDWYSRNGTSGNGFWLLRSVGGLSLYRFAQDQVDTDNSASAKANLAIPFISAKFQAGGQLRGGSMTKLERFRFARYESSGGTGTYTQFVELPKVADVQSIIREVGAKLVRVVLSEKEDDVARPGSSKNLYLDIDGIPARYCSRMMTVRGTSAAALTLGKPTRQLSDEATPVCRFPLRYMVPGTDGQSIDFNLGPLAINLPAGVGPFEIPVKYKLSKSDTPNILNLSQEAVTPIGKQVFPNNVTQLTWQVAGLLKDGGTIDDGGSIDHSGLSPQSCQSDVERTVNFQVGQSLGSRIESSQRPITFTVTARYKNLQQNWQARSTVCRIGGRVKFGVGAEAVERSLPGFEIVVPDDLDTLPLP